MTQYTAPITTAFEVQRSAIEQSQQVVEQQLAFQQQLNEAVIGSLDSHESAQARGVELGRTALYSWLDAVESAVPAVAPSVDEFRETVDEQYDFLFDTHAEAFETLEAELTESADAYDELSEDVVAAVDDQLELLIEASEELESQSVEAAEEWGDQLENLQSQVEEVQEQVQDVQEQAADAVEA